MFIVSNLKEESISIQRVNSQILITKIRSWRNHIFIQGVKIVKCSTCPGIMYLSIENFTYLKEQRTSSDKAYIFPS